MAEVVQQWKASHAKTVEEQFVKTEPGGKSVRGEIAGDGGEMRSEKDTVDPG